MLDQEFLAAARRDLGRFGIERAALVAMEAMAGAGINEDRNARLRRLDLFDVGQWNALILLAEMQHHRRLRLLGMELRNLAAVIADAGRHAVEAGGREE